MKIQFSLFTNIHICGVNVHICVKYFEYRRSFTSPHNFNSLINSTDLVPVMCQEMSEELVNKGKRDTFLSL